MGERSTRVHLPALPSAEFFSRPQHSILDDRGLALLSYDPVTRSGLVYALTDKRWSIHVPIDFEVFAVLVASAGYRLNDCDDTRKWMAACGCPVDGPEAKALH